MQENRKSCQKSGYLRESLVNKILYCEYRNEIVFLR